MRHNLRTRLRTALDVLRHGDDVVLELSTAWSDSGVPANARFAAIGCEITNRPGGGVYIAPIGATSAYGTGAPPGVTVAESFLGTTAAEWAGNSAIITTTPKEA